MTGVTVVCTTYFPPGPIGRRRAQESLEAIASWRRHIGHDDWFRLHIADDGSDMDHWLHFTRALEHRAPSGKIASGFTISRQARRGVGASLNAGFRLAFERHDQVLYAVDDWQLLHHFDLAPWVHLLDESPEDERHAVGMVRLGPPHPWLTGRVEMFKAGWALRLDRHHFAFGHRPALYHRRFFEHYGAFAEGVNAYECERLFAEHFAFDSDGPDILLALPTPWSHVSTVELADVEPS